MSRDCSKLTRSERASQAKGRAFAKSQSSEVLECGCEKGEEEKVQRTKGESEGETRWAMFQGL